MKTIFKTWLIVCAVAGIFVATAQADEVTDWNETMIAVNKVWDQQAAICREQDRDGLGNAASQAAPDGCGDAPDRAGAVHEGSDRRPVETATSGACCRAEQVEAGKDSDEASAGRTDQTRRIYETAGPWN